LNIKIYCLVFIKNPFDFFQSPFVCECKSILRQVCVFALSIFENNLLINRLFS